MVLLKLKPSSLQDRQAALSIRLSTSRPTLSLSESESDTASSSPPFQLVLTVGIVPGTSRRPDQAITIATTGTVLEPSDPSHGLDIAARGALGPLRHIAPDPDSPPQTISLGQLHPHLARRENIPIPRNMRQREWLHWLTIPAPSPVPVIPDETSSPPAVVQVLHDLPLRRIFQHEYRLSKADVTPGSSYRIGLNDRYVGTMWWCWGDLEGDLRDKKFSQWRKGWEGGNSGVEKPSDEEMMEEWVVGENVAELWVEGSNEEAVFQFVE